MKASKVEYNLDHIVLDDDLGPVDQPIPRPKPIDISAIRAAQDENHKLLSMPSSYEEACSRSRDNIHASPIGSSIYFDIAHSSYLDDSVRLLVQRHIFPVVWDSDKFSHRLYPIGFTNSNWTGEPYLIFHAEGEVVVEHNAPAAKGNVFRGVSKSIPNQPVLMQTDIPAQQKIDLEEETFWPVGPHWIAQKLLGKEIIADLQVKVYSKGSLHLTRIEIEDDDSSGVNQKKWVEYPIGDILSEQDVEKLESVVISCKRLSFLLLEDIYPLLSSRELFMLVAVVKSPDGEFSHHIIEPYNPNAVIDEIASYDNGEYGDLVAVVMVHQGKFRSWDAEYLLSNVLDVDMMVFVPSFPKLGESEICGVPILGINPVEDDAYAFGMISDAKGILVAEVRGTLRSIEYSKHSLIDKAPGFIPFMEAKVFTLSHRQVSEVDYVTDRTE